MYADIGTTFIIRPYKADCIHDTGVSQEKTKRSTPDLFTKNSKFADFVGGIYPTGIEFE